MSSSIPTSSSFTESTVIASSLSQVWHLVKLQDFHTWWSALSKSETITGNVSPEADVVKWTFKDGTVLDVKQEEHSAIDHFITYSVIASEPGLSYTSALSTIRLFAVTTGPQAGSTFVTWSGNFSSDADAGVIEDGKFKRREALEDLAKAVAKR